MSELHETSDQKCEEQIDTVGWGFAAFVVIITTIAAIITCHSYDDNTIVANTPVSHVAGPPG
jgi:hypothetical protein